MFANRLSKQYSLVGGTIDFKTDNKRRVTIAPISCKGRMKRKGVISVNKLSLRKLNKSKQNLVLHTTTCYFNIGARQTEWVVMSWFFRG